MARRERIPCGKALVGLCALALYGSALASPMISVDNADFNVGAVVEGKQKLIEHAYTVKNTGDSVLVIKQVRPG